MGEREDLGSVEVEIRKMIHEYLGTEVYMDEPSTAELDDMVSSPGGHVRNELAKQASSESLHNRPAALTESTSFQWGSQTGWRTGILGLI